MTRLINSLDRDWPKDKEGPVAVLAPNHEPYHVTIWDRLAPEGRRQVLRFLSTLKK